MKHVRLPFTLILLSVLLLCGCKAKQDEQAEMKYTDMILKVNDTLYYGSEETGPMGDAGCIEGEDCFLCGFHGSSRGERSLQFWMCGESLYL